MVNGAGHCCQILRFYAKGLDSGYSSRCRVARIYFVVPHNPLDVLRFSRERWHMKKPFSFRDASVVPLYSATPDPRGFFESVLGFMGLEDVWIRVCYADQRRYFGHVVFGKCAVRVTAAGMLSIYVTKAFGRDYDGMDLWFDHFARCFRSAFDNRAVATPYLSL